MTGSRRYPAGLIRLHWLMAVLVVVMLVLGQTMSGLPRGDALKGLLLGWHLAVGVSVLVLAGVRVFLRLRAEIPQEPREPAWRRRLARTVHAALYVLMFVLPLAGLTVYLVDPHVGGPALLGEGLAAGNLAGVVYRVHYFGAWLLLGLMALHVGGSLWPGAAGPALPRMLPGRRTG